MAAQKSLKSGRKLFLTSNRVYILNEHKIIFQMICYTTLFDDINFLPYLEGGQIHMSAHGLQKHIRGTRKNGTLWFSITLNLILKVSTKKSISASKSNGTCFSDIWHHTNSQFSRILLLKTKCKVEMEILYRILV